MVGLAARAHDARNGGDQELPADRLEVLGRVDGVQKRCQPKVQARRAVPAELVEVGTHRMVGGITRDALGDVGDDGAHPHVNFEPEEERLRVEVVAVEPLIADRGASPRRRAGKLHPVLKFVPAHQAAQIWAGPECREQVELVAREPIFDLAQPVAPVESHDIR